MFYWSETGLKTGQKTKIFYLLNGFHTQLQTLFRFYYPFFEILIFVLLVAWLVNSCNMSRPKYVGV